MALSTRDDRQVGLPTDDVSVYLESDPGTVAHALRPLLTAVLGERLPVLVELWDGSTIGPLHAPGVLRVRSRDALRRLLWAPDELGMSRAYVVGDLDIDGDVFEVLSTLRDAVALDARLALKLAPRALAAARATGAFGLPLPPPPEEARPRGRRHSKARDAAVISHHYDVGNDFYRLVLGPSMTYSCARFADPQATLEEAQAAKHELVARKLGLHERPGARLLDVGCGWGTLAMYAAAHHGASVVGITISKEQAARARQRVEEAGLIDRVEIREQDYRDLGGETFDAISSIGMFEHVGEARMAEYFGVLRPLLLPKGRLLNHAISSVGGSRLQPRTFTGRFVFPDGELLDVGRVGAGHGGRRLRGARRRVAPGALRPHAAPVGRQPRGRVGRRGAARRRASGPDLAPLHGRVRRRVRGWRRQHPPGAGRRAHRGGRIRHAVVLATAGPPRAEPGQTAWSSRSASALGLMITATSCPRSQAALRRWRSSSAAKRLRTTIGS